MPKLIITMPEGNDVTQDLTEAEITVGRLPDNMIEISDSSVSGHHAQLVRRGSDYLLQDLGSTNGTRVNDHTITESPLKNGDHVRFGRIESVYQTETVVEARPLPQRTESQAHAAIVPAETSKMPAGFGSASPLKTRKGKREPAAAAIMGLAVLSILAFAGAAFLILQLQPPQ